MPELAIAIARHKAYILFCRMALLQRIPLYIMLDDNNVCAGKHLSVSFQAWDRELNNLSIVHGAHRRSDLLNGVPLAGVLVNTPALHSHQDGRTTDATCGTVVGQHCNTLRQYLGYGGITTRETIGGNAAASTTHSEAHIETRNKHEHRKRQRAPHSQRHSQDAQREVGGQGER